MGTRWRSLRRRVLTPPVSETSLDVRGFHKKTPEAQELLETVGRMFLEGYAYAAEAADLAECERRLEELPVRFRGFAYEGAGMGFAVRDGLPLGRSTWTVDFVDGPAADQVYLVYVGLGWAMARLPRFRWPATGNLDPLLMWLALDGYGFHQAYFKTQKYVHGQYQDPAFPWPDREYAAYANRVIDQGIGRALWFVGGTDPDVVTRLIRSFPAERHGDLYSGAGLACTYAGGGSEAELVAFAEAAGEHRPQLAQGSSFAAEARVKPGLVLDHTRMATRVLCGLTPEDAAQLTIDLRRDLPVDGDVPAYEIWRQRIADQIVSLGGVTR